MLVCIPMSYDAQWNFVLDSGKKTLIESIPIIGSTGYTNINLQANPPYQIIANNTVPAAPNFLDLVDTKTSYSLRTIDFMVQVSSTTYQTIHLPAALGLGAYQYYLSNHSTQTIVVWAQSGDSIDGKALIKLKSQAHATFTSNSYTDWYMD